MSTASSSSRKTFKIWIFVTVIVVTVSVLGGLSWLFVQQNPSPDPTPSSSASPVKTDAQQIAESSVTVFMQAVMENVVQQTSADAEQNVRVATETSATAADGSPAAVATAKLSEFPSGVDVQTNINYLKEVIAQVNSVQGTTWTMLEATDEFADQPNIVGAVKLWEEGETPINPAIVDIVYFNNDGELSIDITATVYLGESPALTDE